MGTIVDISNFYVPIKMGTIVDNRCALMLELRPSGFGCYKHAAGKPSRPPVIFLLNGNTFVF